jgi:hypothetical protein
MTGRGDAPPTTVISPASAALRAKAQDWLVLTDFGSWQRGASRRSCGNAGAMPHTDRQRLHEWNCAFSQQTLGFTAGRTMPAASQKGHTGTQHRAKLSADCATVRARSMGRAV